MEMEISLPQSISENLEILFILFSILPPFWKKLFVKKKQKTSDLSFLIVNYDIHVPGEFCHTARRKKWMWFECKSFPIGFWVWPLGPPQLVMFWKVVHFFRRWSFTGGSLSPLHFLLALHFLSEGGVWLASFLLIPQCLLHYDELYPNGAVKSK